MRRWSIGNGRLIGPSGVVEDGFVVVEGTKIAYAGARRPGDKLDIDAAGGWICPGFIDIHVHGGGGADAMDADAERLETMARSHARHGTTGMLATTMTGPHEGLLRAARAVGDAAARGPGAGARILGLHLEGPYVNPKRAGAQNPVHMRPPVRSELDELYAAAGGFWRLVTVAPELPGALDTIRYLTSKGVAVSLGHTAANLDEALAAKAAGAVSVTHTFNAMNALHHREPGLLGAALDDGHFWAEIIADGLHVHPTAMRLAYKLKGPDKLVLVTDSMRAQGLGDGRYELGDLPVVVRGGEARLLAEDGEPGALAGSVLTMDAAVRTMVQRVGVPMHDAVRMASANPAALLGLQETKGSLTKGMDADVVVLNPELRAVVTAVEGRIVHQST